MISHICVIESTLYLARESCFSSKMFVACLFVRQFYINEKQVALCPRWTKRIRRTDAASQNVGENWLQKNLLNVPVAILNYINI